MYRCKIERVGTIENDVAVGWAMNGEGHPESIGMRIQEDGAVLLGGYSVEDLRKIELGDKY